MEKHYRSDNPNIAVVEDPLAELVDLVSFNQYIGWYDGLPEKAERVTWEIPYNKPVFISEFGGGAKQGYHGDANTIWTEEYQESIYLKTLAMLDKIDGYVGTSPWILANSRSPRRLLNGIQDDFSARAWCPTKASRRKRSTCCVIITRKKPTPHHRSRKNSYIGRNALRRPSARRHDQNAGISQCAPLSCALRR